jgi:hypothetical protein
MPLDLHTVEIIDNSQISFTDRVRVGVQNAVANVAGAAAGDTVTVAVAFGHELPASYTVLVTPSQACSWSVTSKASTGFNVVLTPLVTVGAGATAVAGTIAAGTFDVLVVA